MNRLIIATAVAMSLHVTPEPATEPPLELFRAVAEAMVAEDWRRVAELCDPESLEVFRQGLVSHFEGPLRSPTVEEIIRSTPDMPREVAEYFAAQSAWSPDPNERLALELPTISSVAELRALSPQEVFARWLEAHTPQALMERFARQRGVETEFREMLASQSPVRLRYEPVGTVHDGPDLAHILYRSPPFAAESAQALEEGVDRREPLFPGDQFREYYRRVEARLMLAISTVRQQTDGSWRMIADHNFMGLGSFSVGYGAAVGDER